MLGVAASRVADSLVLARSQQNGSDSFWQQVSTLSTYVLTLPLLITLLARPFLPEDAWRSGWHPLADLTGLAGLSIQTSYLILLVVPWLIWCVFLVHGVVTIRRRVELRPRGVGGLAGLVPSRRWLYIPAGLMLLLAMVALHGLGGGRDAYPAAVWSTVVVVAVSLITLASSTPAWPRSAPSPSPDEEPSATASRPDPWPEVLSAGGVRTETVIHEPKDGPTRGVKGREARELQEHLRSRGARGVAHELIEAVATLLTGQSHDGKPHHDALAFVQDDCGQEEVVAAAVDLTARRFLQSSLVVVPQNALAVVKRLRRWTQEPDRITVVRPGVDPEHTSWIRVVEAGHLSEHLLFSLANGPELRSLGLLVWWELHRYSGVPAANLWAVSRRLYRLIERRGRADLRTLALISASHSESGQPMRYIHRLLPRRFDNDNAVFVERHHPREASIHLLTPANGSSALGGERLRGTPVDHLSLRATRLSVGAGWPTHLAATSQIAHTEREQFLQTTAGATVIRDRLVSRRAEASAEIAELAPADVLALPELLSHGGRAGDPDLPFHLGVTPPSDPYARYIASSRFRRTRHKNSRRLVCAEGHPDILRRHLLLALEESSATLEDLNEAFLLETDLIRETLDDLAEEGRLERTHVRYLGRNGELRRSYRYRSRKPERRHHRPLDTVGADLVAIRHRARSGASGGGVLFRVDPERLPITAYPQRIFVHEGRRYRIRDWNDRDEVMNRRWVECHEEGAPGRTWRRRQSYFQGMDSVTPNAVLSRDGQGVSRHVVTGRYRERVVGVIERSGPGSISSGAAGRSESSFEPIETRFQTRGLFLETEQDEQLLALHSLAQALRHALPVHLGIRAQDMEAVPIRDQRLAHRRVTGVALVDLYPGGIGLVDAVADDDLFLRRLFDATRSWLRSCPCASEAGCEDCLRSPAALAAAGVEKPSRQAALALIDRLP